jgi:mannose-6-phosphate isomerase-like protein (cupin superfamily)
MAIEIFNPTCNLNTIKDGRGAIFSWVPEEKIAEWTFQFINKGKVRGNHCHPEFNEYILLVEGTGVEVEIDTKTGKEQFINMSKGTCIYVPKNTDHVFLAITDCQSVSFLTKPWDECEQPIIHRNLGLGEGDFGDPDSKFNDLQSINHDQST